MCCPKMVSAMTNVFSWQNSVSLCPPSFCTARPNLPVTSGEPRTRWHSRNLQNCNSLLNNHQQENFGSHRKKKDTLCPRTKDGRMGNIMFRIKPHTHQKCSEGPNKTLCAPVPRDPPQRLSQTCLWVFECFLWRNRSVVACCGDKGSGCSIPGSHRI